MNTGLSKDRLSLSPHPIKKEGHPSACKHTEEKEKHTHPAPLSQDLCVPENRLPILPYEHRVQKQANNTGTGNQAVIDCSSPFLRKCKKADTQMGICFFGTPKGTRTPDLLVRSQSLYPTELSAHDALKVLIHTTTGSGFCQVLFSKF